MCKFTYLGYADCDEPERHYLIRREKCSAKAHLKHWCSPNEQDEYSPAEEENRLNLVCPMCADVPVLYDQPLLEIAHSRRSVLPAPHYDAVTGKYSRFPRHHAQRGNDNMLVNYAVPVDASASLVPRPLNMARMQYDRSASEAAVDRVKRKEVSPEYKLPAATYMPSQEEQMMLPAANYLPAAQGAKLPQPLPMPQPVTLTPPSSMPSSRDASLSPPQSRMGTTMRTLPPGESSRRELESIRERQRAAIGQNPRPSTPQSRSGSDRSRSGSESSSTSAGVPPPPPPPRVPARKPSTASSTTSATSSAPSKNGSVSSRHDQPRPQHYRKDSTSTNASASTSRSPPQESGADRFATAALRTIGIDRTASPERGRRPYRGRTGSSSDRSDSPSVWRPTISPPQLQQDSLGIGSNTEIVQNFKQRLVPFAPSKSGSPTRNGASGSRREGRVESPARARTPQPTSNSNNNSNSNNDNAKQTTQLRLYPNKSDDEKVAAAAFSTMFHEERKAMYAAQKKVAFAVAQNPDEETLTAVDMQSVSDITRSGGDPYNVAGVGRRAGQQQQQQQQKALPSVPTGLRRIKTGQVKTVTVAPPRPPKRANTADSIAPVGPSAVAGAPASGSGGVKVKGGPLFSIAGVGGKAQEFEIVSGGGAEGNPLGQVF